MAVQDKFLQGMAEDSMLCDTQAVTSVLLKMVQRNYLHPICDGCPQTDTENPAQYTDR